MRQIFTMLIICSLLATTGCSVLISTPPVARIRMHGLDNQLDEYIVALEVIPTEKTIDIPITDRYAINLDFEWLWGATDEAYIDPTYEYLIQDLRVAPWMMCTYRF